MSWFRVDDGFPEHPKLAALEGDPVLWAKALALWVAGNCYATRNRTDGEIARARVARLVPFRDAVKVAEQLVACGLWEDRGSYFLVHNFLEYNASRAEREAMTAKKTQRQQKWRDRRSTDAHVDASVDASTVRTVDNSVDPAPKPIPKPRENPLPPSAASPLVPAEKLVELWNVAAKGTPLPAAVGLSDKRKRHATARQRPDRDEAWWGALFARVAASPFCRGEKTEWRADLGWLLSSEDNLLKVLEGKYDARAGPGPPSRPAEIVPPSHMPYHPETT